MLAVILLWVGAIGLPACYEYRLEPYDCVVDVCSIGMSGDLLLALGTREDPLGAGPEVVRKEMGIYARQNIPPVVAPIEHSRKQNSVQ